MATRLVTALVVTEPPLRLQWRPNNTLSLIPPFSRRSRPATRHARWDSNAETVRPRRFGFDFERRGQNDDEDEQNDDEDDEEEEEFFRRKRNKRRWWSEEFDDGGVIEEAINTFWVFKVFKAYGWFFPIILASWLLSSGPKAFLMAMALPIGQSLLSMAFDKLWGGTKGKPKRRRPMRKKEYSETEEEGEEEIRGPGKGKAGYQSWVVGSGGSAESGGRSGTGGFGGWDDLERAKSAQRASWGARDLGSVGTEKAEKGKLSRRGRKGETPLLLRLLVAVFPFLGSWTKMLW